MQPQRSTAKITCEHQIYHCVFSLHCLALYSLEQALSFDTKKANINLQLFPKPVTNFCAPVMLGPQQVSFLSGPLATLEPKKPSLFYELFIATISLVRLARNNWLTIYVKAKCMSDPLLSSKLPWHFTAQDSAQRLWLSCHRIPIKRG